MKWAAFPWVSAILYIAALLLAPFISEHLFLLTFAVQLYRMLRYDIRIACIDMAFTISFSSYYRLPGGISYIVFYILLFNIVFLVKRAKLYWGMGLGLLLATVAYIALRSGGQWELLFFMGCGLLFLYLLYHEFENTDHNSVLWGFVIGVLVSSFYAYIFAENELVQDLLLRDAEINDDRFRALLADPNYYATFVILAMVSLMCLDLHAHVNRVFYYIVLAVLVFFGVQTASKSFVLMLLVIVVYYGVSMFSQKKYISGIFMLLLTVLLAAWVIQGRIALFEMVLERFEGAEGMEELTTGRSAVWEDYWNLIFYDMRIMFVGAGLEAPILEFGTHNIFLEMVYNLGLIGMILLLAFFVETLLQLRARFAVTGKQAFIRFLPILAVVMMYFFLQGITSILFYLSMFIMYECYGSCLSKTA